LSARAFTDDDDLAGHFLHGDDAVTGAERLVGSADVIESRGDVILSVLV
jgi:hypothetical protein